MERLHGLQAQALCSLALQEKVPLKASTPGTADPQNDMESRLFLGVLLRLKNAGGAQTLLFLVQGTDAKLSTADKESLVHVTRDTQTEANIWL